MAKPKNGRGPKRNVASQMFRECSVLDVETKICTIHTDLQRGVGRFTTKPALMKRGTQ